LRHGREHDKKGAVARTLQQQLYFSFWPSLHHANLLQGNYNPQFYFVQRGSFNLKGSLYAILVDFDKITDVSLAKECDALAFGSLSAIIIFLDQRLPFPG